LSEKLALLGQFKKYVAPTIVAKNVAFGCQLISLIFIARWFGPEVLGVVTMINFFIILIQMLGVSALEPAFISLGVKKNYARLNRVCQYAALFYCLALLVLTNIFFYFDNETFLLPTIVFSLAIYIHIRSAPAMAFLSENKEFIHYPLLEAVVDVILLLFLFLVKDFQASVLMLSIRYFLSSLMKYLFLLWYVDYRNNFPVEFKSETEKKSFNILLKQFLGYQSFFNSISHIARNIDIFIVNTFFEKTTVGIYDNALKLCRYPALVIVTGLRAVIQPLVKNERDLRAVIGVYEKLTCFLGILSITVAVLISYYSYNIILFLFGEQWVESSEILSVLAFVIVPQMLSVASGFIQGRDRPELLPAIANFTLISFVGCIVFFWTYSPTLSSVSYGVVAANYLTYCYSNFILYSRLFALSYFYFLKLIVFLGCYFFILKLFVHSF
jgi:O-antigen/teichoic acid export membrane protein